MAKDKTPKGRDLGSGSRKPPVTIIKGPTTLGGTRSSGDKPKDPGKPTLRTKN